MKQSKEIAIHKEILHQKIQIKSKQKYLSANKHRQKNQKVTQS